MYIAINNKSHVVAEGNTLSEVQAKIVNELHMIPTGKYEFEDYIHPENKVMIEVQTIHQFEL